MDVARCKTCVMWLVLAAVSNRDILEECCAVAAVVALLWLVLVARARRRRTRSERIVGPDAMSDASWLRVGREEPLQQHRSGVPASPVSSSPSAPAPAGWYEDPLGVPGFVRYWDGYRWTARAAKQSS